MNSTWFTSPEWLALVHALLHTLWHGALAAVSLFVALRIVPVRRVHLRYRLAVGALLAVLVTGVGSWAILEAPPSSYRSAQSRHATAVQPLPSAPATTAPDPVLQAAGTAEQPSPSSSTPGAAHWPQLAAAFWLAGVTLCLLRALRETWSAERLRRRCTILTEPTLLAVTEELRKCLRLTRRVRLMVSKEIAVPSVLGIFWPVILLPAAMLSGLPPEAWRAILAHELAHVRRWDSLVNLGQMLIEAVLFFNPFVWWISWQIRVEREACCDQLAAGECQSPERYVHALMSVIERSRAAGIAAPVAGLAVTGPGHPREGSVLDRARRLLIPGYFPAVRLRWFSLVLVLALFCGSLAGLWTGTRAIAQTITASPVRESNPARKHTFVELKVVTEDGASLQEKSAMVYTHSTQGSGTIGGAARLEDGIAPLHFDADATSISIAAVAEGYAPAYAGPYTPPEKHKMRDLQLTLTKGYSASIQVTNEAGQPIAGAKLQGYYPGPPEIDGSRLTGDSLVVTDSTGAGTLSHIAAAPLNIRIIADGYQRDEITGVQQASAQPLRKILKKAEILPGVVVAAASGQPISGAKIKLAGVRGTHEETHSDPAHAPLVTATNAEGRFTLTTLRPDSRYYFFVEAPGYSGAFLRGVILGGTELKVELRPELFIKGKIINAASAVNPLGNLYLNYGQTFRIGDNSSYSTGKSQEFTPEGAEVNFSVGPFHVPQGETAPADKHLHLEQPIGIWVGDKALARFSFSDLPVSDYVLDVGSQPTAEDPSGDRPTSATERAPESN